MRRTDASSLGGLLGVPGPPHPPGSSLGDPVLTTHRTGYLSLLLVFWELCLWPLVRRKPAESRRACIRINWTACQHQPQPFEHASLWFRSLGGYLEPAFLPVPWCCCWAWDYTLAISALTKLNTNPFWLQATEGTETALLRAGQSPCAWRRPWLTAGAGQGSRPPNNEPGREVGRKSGVHACVCMCAHHSPRSPPPTLVGLLPACDDASVWSETQT